jgi:hypothetical protein
MRGGVREQEHALPLPFDRSRLSQGDKDTHIRHSNAEDRQQDPLLPQELYAEQDAQTRQFATDVWKAQTPAIHVPTNPSLVPCQDRQSPRLYSDPTLPSYTAGELFLQQDQTSFEIEVEACQSDYLYPLALEYDLNHPL